MKSGKREENPEDRRGSRLWKRAENERRKILLSTDLIVIAVVYDCETIVSAESKVAEIKAENSNHLVSLLLYHGNNITKVYLFAKSSYWQCLCFYCHRKTFLLSIPINVALKVSKGM